MTQIYNTLTSNFTKFLRKSGKRNCDCNSMLITPNLTCSECGQLFYKYPDFSFICNVIGLRLETISAIHDITQFILHCDSHRTIALFDYPDEFITKLENFGFTQYRKINSLNDIHYNDIVIISEQVMETSGDYDIAQLLHALKKLVPTFRHKRIIAFVNAKHLKWIKLMEKISNMTIYRHLPEHWINEMKSKFVQTYGNIIWHLSSKQSLLISSHSLFHLSNPIIITNHHPEWWSEEISALLSVK
jgi:hypothetical protein